MCQQCAFVVIKADWILDCIYRGTVSRDRRVTIPLCRALVRTYLDCLEYLILVPTTQKSHRQTGEVPKVGHKNHQRAGDLALLFLEKRRLWKDFITVLQYLESGYKEGGGSLLKEATWRRQGASSRNRLLPCARRRSCMRSSFISV